MRTTNGLHKNTAVLMSGIVFGAGLLQGCRDADHFKNIRIDNADRHFAEIGKRVLPAGKVFTLPECTAAALAKNLHIKAQELREAVTKERATAAVRRTGHVRNHKRCGGSMRHRKTNAQPACGALSGSAPGAYNREAFEDPA